MPLYVLPLKGYHDLKGTWGLLLWLALLSYRLFWKPGFYTQVLLPGAAFHSFCVWSCTSIWKWWLSLEIKKAAMCMHHTAEWKHCVFLLKVLIHVRPKSFNLWKSVVCFHVTPALCSPWCWHWEKAGHTERLPALSVKIIWATCK